MPAPLVILAINVKTPLVQLNRVSMAEAALSTEKVIIAGVQQVIRAQTAKSLPRVRLHRVRTVEPVVLMV